MKVRKPAVYKTANVAAIQRASAPSVYRPAAPGKSAVQPKPVAGSRSEKRSAPPVYRPQQSGTPQAKSAAPAKPGGAKTAPAAAARTVQPQSDYQLSSPMWVGKGRQQIRVTSKGSPTPIGTVDVNYNGGKALISDLEVVQGHRRHGVGTMLMKAAVDSARRNGSFAPELEASPGAGSISRQSLVGMYQKLGFQNAGSTRRGNPRMKTSTSAG